MVPSLRPPAANPVAVAEYTRHRRIWGL